jgi:hypothetical protein
MQDGNGASPARIEEHPMAEVVDAAQKTPAQLFRYSTWLHVGAGAEGCEDVHEDSGEVTCANPLHFHAWCRLPNQFQHREIREKAMAARARRARQLRDPSSDSAVVLSDELDAILRGADAAEVLINELVAKDWWKDYMQAVRDLHEIEDDRGEKPWATIEHDRQRYVQLQSLDEVDRPAEEFAELERHLTAYGEALEALHKELVEPKRQALAGRDPGELAELVREQRIEGEAQEEFMHIYSTWEWLVGTLRCPGGERRFVSLEQMQAAAPEVIAALDQTFDDLERTFDAGPTKNS